MYKFIIEAITINDFPVIKQDSRIIECIDKINPNAVQQCIDILYDYLDKRLPLTREMENIRNIFYNNSDIKLKLKKLFSNINYFISNELETVLLREIDMLQI